jgi:hypothetical protein
VLVKNFVDDIYQTLKLLHTSPRLLADGYKCETISRNKGLFSWMSNHPGTLDIHIKKNFRVFFSLCEAIKKTFRGKSTQGVILKNLLLPPFPRPTQEEEKLPPPPPHLASRFVF